MVGDGAAGVSVGGDIVLVTVGACSVEVEAAVVIVGLDTVWVAVGVSMVVGIISVGRSLGDDVSVGGCVGAAAVCSILSAIDRVEASAS